MGLRTAWLDNSSLNYILPLNPWGLAAHIRQVLISPQIPLEKEPARAQQEVGLGKPTAPRGGLLRLHFVLFSALRGLGNSQQAGGRYTGPAASEAQRERQRCAGTTRQAATEQTGLSSLL